MKEKLKNGFLILLAAGVYCYLLFSAVSDLTNKTNLHTIRLDMGGEILSVEHSVSGLIPIGTDHYYIGVNGETGEAYLLRGPKNFQLNEGTQITALAKKISDYEIQQELAQRAAQLEGISLPLGLQCLRLSYRKDACIKLLTVLLTTVLLGITFWARKTSRKFHPNLVKAYLIAIMADLVLLLISIRS